MKNNIIFLVLGVALTITVYHGYVVYEMKKTIELHDNTIVQIVNFINSSMQENQDPRVPSATQTDESKIPNE